MDKGYLPIMAEKAATVKHRLCLRWPGTEDSPLWSMCYTCGCEVNRLLYKNGDNR